MVVVDWGGMVVVVDWGGMVVVVDWGCNGCSGLGGVW